MSCHNQPVSLGVVQCFIDPGPLLVGQSLRGGSTGRTASIYRVGYPYQKDCINEDKLHCGESIIQAGKGDYLEEERILYKRLALCRIKISIPLENDARGFFWLTQLVIVRFDTQAV